MEELAERDRKGEEDFLDDEEVMVAGGSDEAASIKLSPSW